MTTRKYSSRSQQTTLTGAITSGATAMTVVSGSALLGGVTIPAGTTFTLVIDVDTALEEIIDATAVSTNTFTITRAIDGSSAQDHSAGAVVRHMAIGRDYRDANLHAEASAYYNDGSGTGHTMHGISSGEGDVVGTAKTQTLTNKTLTSPTITNPSISGAGVDASIVFEGATADAYETTLTVIDPTQDNTVTIPNTTGTVVLDSATQTLTNKTLTSPTISGSPVITGLSSAGMISSSATPKDYVDSILGSATAAATSAASAATSANSAATSATSAANSATAASTSATSASNFATAASTSATSAAASATAANTSASSAATSASSALTSANSASTSASSALTSANSASTSATSAQTFATNAATSATSAAASATAAATSATSAAASATAAATSASSASTSASSALTSANSAAISAASAAAAVTSAIQASIIDAKGDLIVGSANDTAARLASASTNGYVLTVNSATATGLEWAAANPGDITSVTASFPLTGGGTSGDVTVGIQDASTSQKGAVQLTDSTASTSVTTAATPNSVKSAYDLANAAVPKSLADAKGDIFVASADNTVARLGVGTDGYLLTASSTATNGVTWAAAPVSLPTQTGNGGKLLTTDGTTASWAGAAPAAQTTEPSTLIDGLIWVDTDGTAPTTVVTRWQKTGLAAGTTSLSGNDDNNIPLAYTPGYEQVFLNGTLLSRANDYTATSGTSITLTTGVVTGDIVEVICATQVAYADTYTQAQSDARFSLNTSAFFAGKNKIINGDFGIWQRGTSFSAQGYLCDRFRTQFNGSSSTRTMSQQTFTAGTAPVTGYEGTYFFRYDQSVAGTGGTYSTFEQYIEDVRTLANQTATFSFWAKAAAGVTITAQLSQNFGSGGSATVDLSTQNVVLTTSWQRFTLTFSVPSVSGKTIGTGSALRAILNMPLNTTFTIDTWGWQLEAGSVATAFQTATGTIQGELAACQRYYYRNTASQAFSNFSMATANNSSTDAATMMHLPVTMRVAPTSVDYANLRLTNYTAGFAVTSVAVSTNFNGSTVAGLAIGVASGLTGGNLYALQANNNSAGYIGVSAEL